MGLTFYSTSIDLGFCSWFSILVYAQWFSSRLGRIFRVTEKVLLRVTAKVRGIVRGHGKVCSVVRSHGKKRGVFWGHGKRSFRKVILLPSDHVPLNALKNLKKLRKRIFNPNRPQTFAVTPSISLLGMDTRATSRFCRWKRQNGGLY